MEQVRCACGTRLGTFFDIPGGRLRLPLIVTSVDSYIREQSPADRSLSGLETFSPTCRGALELPRVGGRVILPGGPVTYSSSHGFAVA